MITRRSVLLAGGVGLLIARRRSHAQPAATMRRVGFLATSSDAMAAHAYAALKQGMQDLGWLEGKHVEYRIVSANGDVDRLGTLAGELIEQKVDVIIVGNVQTTRAAQRATRTIPIVMAGTANAVGAGFVASLAKPGGNITGFTSQQDEVLGKLIGILHEVAPGAQRIAILVNENNPLHAVLWAGARSACAALDLVALRVVASTPAQIGAAVEQTVRQKSQAIVVTADGMFYAESAKLQALTQASRLPAAYEFREHVIAGGLLSYGTDIAANYRHAAKYVDKILKGTKPADLPVEQSNKFDLVINAKTAKALGLTIPQSLLLLANEVIQ